MNNIVIITSMAEEAVEGILFSIFKRGVKEVEAEYFLKKVIDFGMPVSIEFEQEIIKNHKTLNYEHCRGILLSLSSCVRKHE